MRKKQLKDYIHFHLGCEIVTAEERYNSPGLKLIGIKSDGTCELRDESIKLSFYVNVEDCKLVLYKVNVKPPFKDALEVKFLLENNFDFFNLYEDGLCIYKTE